MLADQVRHAQSNMDHGLDIPIVGRRAAQTPSTREWSTALSQLCMSPISYSPGCGLPELLQGKMVPTRSVSPVGMKMMWMRAMHCQPL